MFDKLYFGPTSHRGDLCGPAQYLSSFHGMQTAGVTVLHLRVGYEKWTWTLSWVSLRFASYFIAVEPPD